MVRAMRDAYIPKDGQGTYSADFGDARFFAASTAEKPLLALDGGITMDSNAFRDDIPTISHTPEELGMRLEGTPFEKQGEAPIDGGIPDEMKADPPVGGYPITHDVNSYPPNESAIIWAARSKKGILHIDESPIIRYGRCNQAGELLRGLLRHRMEVRQLLQKRYQRQYARVGYLGC